MTVDETIGALTHAIKGSGIRCNELKVRIPAKPITDSGLKPVSQTGGAGHWSERSDAGVALWV